MAVDRPAREAPGFEAAVHTESGRLFAVAYSILRDPQEAEDAVQETMELAWRSWDALRDPSKRSAWLRQICVRRAIRSRRRLLPRLWLADTSDLPRQPPHDPDTDRAAAHRRPSPQHRAAVTLH